MQPNPTETHERRKARVRRIISGTVCIILLLTITGIYFEFNPTHLVANNVIVYALVNVNILLLMALILLVLRNLLKLYFERRQGTIGTRFRAKLVTAFVGLALVPSVLLFVVANGLINRSIESWFSAQVERTLKDSQVVVQQIYDETEKRLSDQASVLARRIDPIHLDRPDRQEALRRFLEEKLRELQLDGLQVFAADQKVSLNVRNPAAPKNLTWTLLKPELVDQVLSGKNFVGRKSLKTGEAVRAVAALASGEGSDRKLGLLVLSRFFPASLAQRMEAVVGTYREYKELEMFRDPLKLSYLITFLLITLLIIFSALWFGFYLARGITEPIQALVEGTRAVAEGNLDIHVGRGGDDEIGYLVDAFNAMTADLKRGKERLERSNAELERRRVYMERVLERIGAGVVSVDRRGRVTTISRAAERMLGVKAEDALGSHYREVFSPALIEPARELFREIARARADRMEAQRPVTVGGRLLTLLISVSVLTDRDGKALGMVLVFEDLTDLLKAQKLAAWREVAQGIAHEVKNPLTPIQLSTQRLRKKYQEASPDFNAIFEECTNVIINQVKGLMKLVNEFSHFARMPEPRPRSCDLHDLIRETIALYSGYPKTVCFETDFDERLGRVNLDEEQMKRVFINLIDNAIDAVPEKGHLRVRTFRDDFRGMLRIEFSDDGPGIPAEDRGRLFLPYFTTKGRGTGLGLAIVHRIVADHDGSIEVRDNVPHGATFEIRLPLNGESARTRLAV
ncbi:MAG: PAS domain S-box protein [Candidatus Tectomicrobia bacterium]|nr:PAS domain S-box protein [Candidatus Tectomicrobia bacterium]